MFTVDFDFAVKEHNRMLTDKLRDFGEENLQYWVPEENFINSIISIVYSVALNDVKSFKILFLNSNIKEKKEIENLEKNLNSFSRFNLQKNNEKFELEIKNYDFEKIKTFIEKKSFSEVTKSNNIRKLENKKFYESNTLKADEKLKIINKYSENLSKKTNLINKNQLFLETKLDEKKFLKVNLKNNLDIFFHVDEKKLLDIKVSGELSKDMINLFALILNEFKDLPFEECTEHALIKLENLLCDDFIRDKIKGVTTVFFIKHFASDAKKILANAEKLFLKKLNLNKEKNLFDIQLSKEWMQLSEKEMEESVFNCIEKFNKLNNTNIILSKIEEKFKIFIDFDKESSISTNYGSKILELEKFFKKNLEKRVEVFYVEIKDANKLRIKNSPL